MVYIKSFASTIALAALSIQTVTAADWFVVGVHDDWKSSRTGGTTHKYSIAAKNMNTGAEVETKHSGAGRSSDDICGSKLFGAEVWCFQPGNIGKECQGYEVAAFNSRRCRTYCPSIGDKSPLYNYNLVTSGEWFRVHLICDRPYP
ncbi:uncharacterized protein CTRU02_211582 [Colletotrichum truncatum]|uniref:Uncharacterized protein n=1 Tax=Colletotrichum truncatum TaxID=5467 RepID=A0ACC3YL36_COLTU|nr:uncharacterized protein CTRU02_14089 [Colletotrichum truncatum]KAF6782608.1 hypothetical protein CTRU02_14089 [Colletotrichum truncatum]